MTTPTEIDRHAPVIADHRIRISTPREFAWKVLIDVSGWPRWQTDIQEASLDRPLASGSSFRWSTFGMNIVSTVYALDAGSRILWGGSAGGIVGIHEWQFTDVLGGVEVQTKESFAGPSVEADTKNLQRLLDQSLVSWLERLKAMAETT